MECARNFQNPVLVSVPGVQKCLCMPVAVKKKKKSAPKPWYRSFKEGFHAKIAICHHIIGSYNDSCHFIDKETFYIKDIWNHFMSGNTQSSHMPYRFDVQSSWTLRPS